jgi:hypothetical protein
VVFVVVLAEVASFAAVELAAARTELVWVLCLGVEVDQGDMEEPEDLA